MTTRKRPAGRDVIDAVAAYLEAAEYAARVSRLTSGVLPDAPGWTAWTKAYAESGIRLYELAAALGGDRDAYRLSEQLRDACRAGSERAEARAWERTAADAGPATGEDPS